MNRKLITFLIIVSFCIEACGVDCLFPTAHTYKDTLRPMASAVSGDASVSMSSKTLRASSPGRKKDSDIDGDDKATSHSQGHGLKNFDLIFKEFQIRNRMYITSDDAGRKRKAERLKYVIEKTKDIPDFLIEKFKDKKIISIIVLGTYLWFEKSSDIELLIITEGEDELEILDRDFIPTKELLKDKKVSLTGIECIAATVGYDRLKRLDSWQAYSYAIRGSREGITIFGIDPYKAKELSSCKDKIERLDYLLGTSEQSIKELESPETAGAEEKLHKDRIKERTTEAISILKEIVSRYGKEEIFKSLEEIEQKYKRRELRQLKKYCQQVHKIYERFMKELKAKPRPSGRKKAEPTSKGEELSRPEQLNMILEEHTELDTPEKLLVFIKKHEPHLLDAISGEKQLEFLRDFMFLGYETVPLPKEVLERIAHPEMKAGTRIAEIREARRKEPKDILARISEKVKQGIARSKEDIDDSTYSDIENSKGIPAPHQLFDIARELMVDPIRIIDGRDWDGASAGLPDNEKMRLCRRRKGWTQEECALAFEKAGLDFGARKTITSKTAWVSACERGKELPNAEQARVIQRVFCDKTLFEEATEEAKVQVEAPVTAAPKAAVTPRVGVLEEKEAKKAKAPTRAAGKKVRRLLPGVRKTKIHLYFADHWQEIAGKTPSEIEEEHGIPAVSTRTFCRKNKGAAEHFGIEYPAKRKIPQKKREVLAAELGPSAERKPAAQPPAAEAADKEAKEAAEAEEKADMAAEEAEETEGMPTKKKAAKRAKKAKKAEEAEPGKKPGRVIIEEPEADYAVYIGRDTWECLRTAEDREFVDGMGIEDAIYDLERICDKAEDMIEKEASPEIQKKIMRQWRWIEARSILRRLKPLVSTELCDWDSPEIGQKAAEITIGLVIDLDKVNKIKEWVEKNVSLVPEFDGCWNTKASETSSLSKGTHFNRANLIVAMLRSIGIPARYRIISLKKEMAEDTVSKGTPETEEHIVVEALISIEGYWNEITGDISRKCKWITLESVEAENIIESYAVDNIDEYAGEKAKEYKRKAKARTKGQRGSRGRANPSEELKALKAISSSA